MGVDVWYEWWTWYPSKIISFIAKQFSHTSAACKADPLSLEGGAWERAPPPPPPTHTHTHTYHCILSDYSTRVFYTISCSRVYVSNWHIKFLIMYKHVHRCMVKSVKFQVSSIPHCCIIVYYLVVETLAMWLGLNFCCLVFIQACITRLMWSCECLS